MAILSEMEISSLILLVRAHDDMAFAELVARYTPMMNKVASGFCIKNVRADEIFSEACVAIYRAALSYDLSRTDITFGLYARICVHRRLCDFAGKENVGQTVDVDVATLARANVIEEGIVGRETLRRSIVVARSLLSDYEYKVFRLYLKGYTTAEIAKKLSKTAKSVDNAKSRMMKHLRDNSAVFVD